MKFLDFFAGIGGFHSAFSRIGWECQGFCEIDKFARQSYKAIHNTEGIEEWHDITKVSDDDFRRLRGRVDIIAGGFPCQAFSVAGKRGGFEDTRGTLFFEVARAAKIIQPRYLLLENVKGLLNHDKGNTFGTILNTLYELGYAHIEWGVFNTKYWGVPQNRERVFILAELRDEPTAPYLLPLLQQQHENGVTARLRDVLETKVDEKYYLSEEKTAKLIETLEDRVKVKEATKQGYTEAFPGDTVNMAQPNSKTRRGRVGRELANTLLTGQEQAVVEPVTEFVGIGHHPFSKKQEFKGYFDDVSPCLIATDYKAPKTVLEKTNVEPLNRHDSKILDTKSPDKLRVYDQVCPTIMANDFKEPKIAVHATLTPDRVEKRQNGRRFKDEDEPMFTLTAQDKHGIATVQYSRKTGIGKEIDTSVCLSASDWRGLNRNQEQNAVLETSPKYRVRKLTPLECWRLQDFTDEQFYKARAAGVSDSQLYKQAGNSVTVKVVEVIARQIQERVERENEMQMRQ